MPRGNGDPVYLHARRPRYQQARTLLPLLQKHHPFGSLFGLFIQTILKLQGMFLRDDACPILNRASFDLREIVILIRKDVLYISFTLLSIKNYSCE